MKIFFSTIIIATVFSCNSTSTTKDVEKSKTDSSVIDSSSTSNITTPVQINPVRVIATELPLTIKTKGKVQEAWMWTDQLGENYFITSEVKPFDDKDEDGNEATSASLYAYHFAKAPGDAAYTQVWMLSDQEKGCGQDLTCRFAEGSSTVTDLDKDGIAELKLQYVLACRGDVSPAVTKLLLYENGVKYGLDGYSWLPYSPDIKYSVTEQDVNLEKNPIKDEGDDWERSFGRYKSEKEFATAPPEFLSFARNEWMKHSVEKMGE